MNENQQLAAQLRDAYQHVGLYGYAIGEFALIKILIDYKIFDNIPDEGNIAIADLAMKVHGEQEILERFILQLSVAGVLSTPSPAYVAHTHKSRLYKSDTLEAGLVLHVFDMLLRPLAQLPTYFRTHGLASPKDATVTPFGMAMGYPGSSVYEILGTDGNLQNQFNRVLKSLGNMYSLKGVYDFGWVPAAQVGTRAAVVDIGGSSGLALKDILKNNPSIPGNKCALYDLPRVVEHTKSTCDASLTDIQFVGGDVLQPFPVQLRGACVYHLRRILNDFTDEDVLRALRRVKEAAAADSKILVVEEMLNADRNMLNVGMDIFLMLVGGKKRSTDMFSKLASSVGLRLNAEFKAVSGSYDDYSVLEFVVAEGELEL